MVGQAASVTIAERTLAEQEFEMKERKELCGVRNLTGEVISSLECTLIRSSPTLNHICLRQPCARAYVILPAYACILIPESSRSPIKIILKNHQHRNPSVINIISRFLDHFNIIFIYHCITSTFPTEIFCSFPFYHLLFSY